MERSWNNLELEVLTATNKGIAKKNKVGRYAFWPLIILLVFVHLSNLFGPPPTNVKAIAWAAQLQWVFVIWAYWVDRNRTALA